MKIILPAFSLLFIISGMDYFSKSEVAGAFAEQFDTVHTSTTVQSVPVKTHPNHTLFPGSVSVSPSATGYMPPGSLFSRPLSPGYLYLSINTDVCPDRSCLNAGYSVTSYAWTQSPDDLRWNNSIDGSIPVFDNLGTQIFLYMARDYIQGELNFISWHHRSNYRRFAPRSVSEYQQLIRRNRSG